MGVPWVLPSKYGFTWVNIKTWWSWSWKGNGAILRWNCTSPHSLLALTHRSFSEKFHSHLAKKGGQLQSPRDDFGSPIFGGTPRVRCGWATASCRISCHDGGLGRWCLEWEDETFDPWKMAELADCFGVATSCVCSIHLYLNLSLSIYIYTYIQYIHTWRYLWICFVIWPKHHLSHCFEDHFPILSTCFFQSNMGSSSEGDPVLLAPCWMGRLWDFHGNSWGLHSGIHTKNYGKIHHF